MSDKVQATQAVSPAVAGRESEPRLHDGRMHSLTGLRWIAALVVFGAHFIGIHLGFVPGATRLPTTEHWMNILFGTGQISVSVFFILSGFILAWSSRPGDTATAFWRRRFAKIYPVYIVSSIFGLIILLIIFHATPGWKIELAQLFMVQAWVPQQFYYLNLDAVTWSLSCEALFYLCFPMLLFLFRQAKTKSLRLTAVGCFLFTLIIPYLASHAFTTKSASFQLTPVAQWGGQFADWFTYYFPVTRLAEFLLGITIAVLFQRGKWIGPRVPLAIAITVGGFVLNRYLPPLVQLEAGMMIPFALLIPALARADLEGTWSPLRWRPLVWLGTISYSFFAVHYLIVAWSGIYLRTWLWHLHLVSNPLNPLPQWADILAFFGYLGVSIFASWVMYRLVEDPFYRRLRPKSPPKDKPAAAGMTAPAEDSAVPSTT